MSCGIDTGSIGWPRLQPPLHRSSDDAAALRASASKPWHITGATCTQIRAPAASKGEHPCDVFARIGSSRSLVWRRCAPVSCAKRWRMERLGPVRERVLGRFEGLAAIELMGVADRPSRRRSLDALQGLAEPAHHRLEDVFLPLAQPHAQDVLRPSIARFAPASSPRCQWRRRRTNRGRFPGRSHHRG
jgi:hypothetical protein